MISKDLRIRHLKAETGWKARKGAHFAAFAKVVNDSLEMTAFHSTYYEILDRFARGEIRKLIVTVPPQHGKSLGATILLPAYLLGKNPNLRIAIASYAQSLALKFSRSIQRYMSGEEYKRIFTTRLPEMADKGYTRTAENFDVIGGIGGLMAVGRGGGLTGNRVDVFVLDDLYKDSAEANSPTVRESTWDWKNSVVDTRQHNDSQELIVFTRWHEEDLIGELVNRGFVRELTDINDIDPDYKGHYIVNFEAIKDSDPTPIDPRERGEVLWDSRHSLESLQKKRKLDPHTFECLYQGQPSSKEGYLYGEFNTYDTLPENITRVANYTDTADTGEDYLCSICYVVAKGKAYITDILYTSEPMEVTEGATASMMLRNGTISANIESNNGGRGFARVVAEKCPNVAVEWFHQSSSKESRILTNAASVCHNIVMPADWRVRFPKFHNDVVTYKRKFNANKHDDAADALTGIVEKEVFTLNISEADRVAKFNRLIAMQQ